MLQRDRPVKACFRRDGAQAFLAEVSGGSEEVLGQAEKGQERRGRIYRPDKEAALHGGEEAEAVHKGGKAEGEPPDENPPVQALRELDKANAKAIHKITRAARLPSICGRTDPRKISVSEGGRWEPHPEEEKGDHTGAPRASDQ